MSLSLHETRSLEGCATDAFDVSMEKIEERHLGGGVMNGAPRPICGFFLSVPDSCFLGHPVEVGANEQLTGGLVRHLVLRKQGSRKCQWAE